MDTLPGWKATVDVNSSLAVLRIVSGMERAVSCIAAWRTIRTCYFGARVQRRFATVGSSTLTVVVYRLERPYVRNFYFHWCYVVQLSYSNTERSKAPNAPCSVSGGLVTEGIDRVVMNAYDANPGHRPPRFYQQLNVATPEQRERNS